MPVVSELASVLPILLIAVLFWLLLVRPQQKRHREMARMQSSLEVGDRVVLTSGIHGTVTALADDTVEVEVASGVVITAARAAIGQAQSPQGSGSGEDRGAGGDADAGQSGSGPQEAD